MTRTHAHVLRLSPDRVDETDYVKADPEAYLRLARAVEASCVDAVSIEDAHRHNDLSLLDAFAGTTVILGVVEIASSRVETVDEIVERLRAALDHIDADRLMAAPDCGLIMLGADLARAKLGRLVAAARAVSSPRSMRTVASQSVSVLQGTALPLYRSRQPAYGGASARAPHSRRAAVAACRASVHVGRALGLVFAGVAQKTCTIADRHGEGSDGPRRVREDGSGLPAQPHAGAVRPAGGGALLRRQLPRRAAEDDRRRRLPPRPRGMGAGAWSRAGSIADWFFLARKAGDAIAPLIGALAGEVVVADFHLGQPVQAGGLPAAPKRGPAHRRHRARQLPHRRLYPGGARSISSTAGSTSPSRRPRPSPMRSTRAPRWFLLTHVNFRTGAMHDMARIAAHCRQRGVPVIWDLQPFRRRRAARAQPLGRGVRRRLHLQVPERRAGRAGLHLHGGERHRGA